MWMRKKVCAYTKPVADATAANHRTLCKGSKVRTVNSELLIIRYIAAARAVKSFVIAGYHCYYR